MIGLKGLLTRYQVQQNPLKTERRIELAGYFLTAIVLLVLMAMVARWELGSVASQGPEPDIAFCRLIGGTEVRARRRVIGRAGCGNLEPSPVLAESTTSGSATQGGR